MIKVLKILMEKWYLVLIVAGCIIAQTWLQLELPEYMGTIQNLITNNTTGANITNQILQQGGWMILISVGIVLLAVIQFYFGSFAGAYVGKRLRQEMFHKVNTLSLTDYNNFGTATLITRTTNDIEQIKNFVIMAIRTLFMSPTMMIIAIIKTVEREALLASVIAICIPLIIVVMVILLALTSPLFKKIQKNTDDLTVVFRENLTGVRVVRAYCQQPKEDEKFQFANTNITKTIVKIGRIMSVANPFINVLFNLCFIGIYALGFYILTLNSVSIEHGATVIQDQITTISVVSQYSMQIMMSFLMFAMMFIMVPSAMASQKRINQVLNTPSSKDDESTGKYKEEDLKKSPLHGVIEFNNVSFSYPDSEKPCIEHISFTTHPGKTTAIIGSTGSGKSSLINLIPRFYDATQGDVSLDGFNVKDIKPSILREHLGFIPQSATLFKGTIRENIKFGKDDASDEEIMKALDVAQANHFISKLPDGLDSYVSQGGKNFSGGQKQRLSIARALIRKPEIYIFDDSFSALDFKTDSKLRYALKSYTGDSSIIVVAQRVSSIIDADNIIVLDEGKCVGQGTHVELLKNCSVYQNIVKSQLDPEEVEKTIRMISDSKKLEAA